MRVQFKAKDPAEAELRYGAIVKTATGKLVWPNESNWMTLLALPKITHKIINSATGKPWDKVYCNKDVAKPLVETLELMHIIGILAEIKTFDGCFNVRDRRGAPGKLSLHSYGLALDFNASLNPLGSTPKWSDRFIATMRRMGWCYGGDFKRLDGMHFSWIGDENSRALHPAV